MKVESIKSEPLNETDFLRLNKLRGAHFHGSQPGDVLVLFYAERHSANSFNSVGSEYFSPLDIAKAEGAFQKRVAAENPCRPIYGRAPSDILPAAPRRI
ncbi:MAG: hypothetical protein DI537_10345 [Stutzerimonas stutzeri]|nr:MAG: hypothetical protein DI537_10345 [Stutzerimonas stutzeri]